MAQTDASQIVSGIYEQRQIAPLSILGLAEPIVNYKQQEQPQQADDSQSQDGSQLDLDPATLATDLQHYRELFSKLRFSYLEQVTKEKFIKNIIAQPPVIATAEENAQLEERLAIMKAELQVKKRDVDALVVEIEQLARNIAIKYDIVEDNVKQLETLPAEINELEKQVEELRQQLSEKEGQVVVNDDPRMNLSLEETNALIEQQEQRNEELKRKIERYERDLPVKVAQCEEAERELQELEKERQKVTKAARDAQKRKQEGKEDLLQQQTQWYEDSTVVLRGLLGVT